MESSYWTFNRNIRIRFSGYKVLVSTPYQEEWVRRCRVMGGKYRPRTRLWSFPVDRYESVARHIAQAFQVSVPDTIEALMKARKYSATDVSERVSVED